MREEAEGDGELDSRLPAHKRERSGVATFHFGPISLFVFRA